MSQNSHDCLICLRYAKKRRSQIDNYGCECDYYIHQSCYDRWRVSSRTDRLCIICDARNIPPVEIIQYGAEVARLDHIEQEEQPQGRCARMCEECILIFLAFVFILMHFIRNLIYERNLRALFF